MPCLAATSNVWNSLARPERAEEWSSSTVYSDNAGLAVLRPAGLLEVYERLSKLVKPACCK